MRNPLSIVGLVSICMFVTGCGEMVSEDRAVNTLQAEGWTQVNITDKYMLATQFTGGCGDGYGVAFEATGNNPAGNPSTAIVCCRLVVKSCYIH